MCSRSTKGRVSLVIEAEAEGAEEEVAEAEAGVRGKCKDMKTWPLHEPLFFYCRDRTEDTSYTILREIYVHNIKILPYLFT